MVTFPMMSLSVFGAAGTGVIEFPALGVFIAVFLTAALVGSALGLLREMTSPHADSAAVPSADAAAVAHLDSDPPHRAAA